MLAFAMKTPFKVFQQHLKYALLVNDLEGGLHGKS
jgi:hypothetical protein